MPLYIAKSGDLDRCYRCLTDRLTDSQRKDSATQLLIKYKSGALVTQLTSFPEVRNRKGAESGLLQPEVAEVLDKVQRAVTEEIFPHQIDLLNNLLKPLLGIKESINCLFNSTDKNQTRDMEREVEMLVSQIQVSTLLRGLNGLVRVAERLLFLQHEQEARAGVRQWQVDPGVQVVEGVQEGLG